MSEKKKSIVEQMIAISSLIFAIVLIFILALPQMLQALFRLIYCHRTHRDIRGKLAIVTGGGNELGKNIVHKLADRGCNLVIVGENLIEIERLAEEIASKDVKVKVYGVKTCDNREVFKLFNKVNEEFSNVDLLINIPHQINYTSDSSDLISTKANADFNSAMFMTLKFLDKLKNQSNSAHIITISSSAGISESPKLSSDSPIFSFMHSISEHLKTEKLGEKIKTTCVVSNCFQNGKIISDYVNKFFKFHPIDANVMAEEIINRAIQEDDSLIEIPNNQMNLSRLLRYFKIQFSGSA